MNLQLTPSWTIVIFKDDTLVFIVLRTCVGESEWKTLDSVATPAGHTYTKTTKALDSIYLICISILSVYLSVYLSVCPSVCPIANIQKNMNTMFSANVVFSYL